MQAIVLAVALFALHQADSAQQSTNTDITGLSWIAGSWVMEHGGTRVEELWTPPRAGTMMGVGRTMKGDQTVFFEFFRIASTPDGIVYFASPGGRHPPTPFKMTEMTDDKVVFENPKHDFPTRISYWKEKDGAMGAKIEGKRNGQDASENWVYKRASE